MVSTYLTNRVQSQFKLRRGGRDDLEIFHCQLGSSRHLVVQSSGLALEVSLRLLIAANQSIKLIIAMYSISPPGADNIYNHMCKMLGFKPPRILYYLWVYISPACLLVSAVSFKCPSEFFFSMDYELMSTSPFQAILVFSIVKYDPPEYAGKPFPWYVISVPISISQYQI